MSHYWKPAMYSHADKHGSVVFALGGRLDFQDGSIFEYGENGVTNEEVIEALIERLIALNSGEFACKENAVAITHLETAMLWLEYRTSKRKKRGVEGKSIQ